MFVAREKELKDLEERYANYKFEMAIIYGRRRVGKTYLIKEFIKDKPGAYFVALETSSSLNLEYLSQAIYQATDSPSGLPAFCDYVQAFRFLFQTSLDKRFVFVIDEYPYLQEAEPSVASALQIVIDEFRTDSKLMLILCGSSMSFMEEQVLGAKSPLYGRRTAQYFIKPFNYLESSRFFTGYNNEELALIYAVTGGVAEYLTFIDESLSVSSNIKNLFLSTSGRLYEEPDNLLKQELREPKIYSAVLESIAAGATRANEIATKVGISSSGLNSYLNPLISLQIVEKVKPVGEKSSRRTIYKIKDSMYRFSYRFVLPNKSLIELGLVDKVYKERVEPYLNDFMNEVFEDMSKEFLELEFTRGNLPFTPTEYGQWWGNNPVLRREEEIDIVAISDDQAIFCECKWWNKKVSNSVLSDLRDKVSLFKQSEKYLWLFAKKGYTFTSDNKKVRLISLDDMYE